MDFEKARYFMVEQQIRPWNVLDHAVLARLMALKREDFVADVHKQLALADVQLPIAVGASMLEPKLEARLLQEAQLQPEDRVLVVGAGSGYLMALAAGLCLHVYGVEIESAVFERAVANLTMAKIRNAAVSLGDGLAGLPDAAPFDAIILTGSVQSVPEALLAQLAEGGRLVAVQGQDPIMQAIRIERDQDGVCRTHNLFECHVAPLRAERGNRFQF